MPTRIGLYMRDLYAIEPYTRVQHIHVYRVYTCPYIQCSAHADVNRAPHKSPEELYKRVHISVCLGYIHTRIYRARRMPTYIGLYIRVLQSSTNKSYISVCLGYIHTRIYRARRMPVYIGLYIRVLKSPINVGLFCKT